MLAFLFSKRLFKKIIMEIFTEIYYSRLNVVWDMNVVPGFSLLGERVDGVLPSHQPKICSSPHLEQSPPPPPPPPHPKFCPPPPPEQPPPPPPPSRLPPTKFLFPSYQKSIPAPLNKSFQVKTQ